MKSEKIESTWCHLYVESKKKKSDSWKTENARAVSEVGMGEIERLLRVQTVSCQLNKV